MNAKNKAMTWTAIMLCAVGVVVGAVCTAIHAYAALLAAPVLVMLGAGFRFMSQRGPAAVREREHGPTHLS